MYGATAGEPKTFWENLENAYYGFCDYLEDKGIGIYGWFVNPLENNGIPSLNAAIVIMLALLIGVTGVAMRGSTASLGVQDNKDTIANEPPELPVESPTADSDGGTGESQELPPLPPDSTPPAQSETPLLGADDGSQPPPLPPG